MNQTNSTSESVLFKGRVTSMKFACYRTSILFKAKAKKKSNHPNQKVNTSPFQGKHYFDTIHMLQDRHFHNIQKWKQINQTISTSESRKHYFDEIHMLHTTQTFPQNPRVKTNESNYFNQWVSTFQRKSYFDEIHMLQDKHFN